MDGVVKTPVIHHLSVEILFFSYMYLVFSPVIWYWPSEVPQFCLCVLILSHLNEHFPA